MIVYFHFKWTFMTRTTKDNKEDCVKTIDKSLKHRHVGLVDTDYDQNIKKD